MKNSADEIQVTVFCMCFNHEPYIRQCLDSIVGQKTTFPFQVLVHDDASTDGSAEIIREYEKRYPDLLKGILQTENLYSKEGFLGIQRRLAQEKRGKYIAFCECDDYWLDPRKLQKQYDAAERHGAVFCTHQVRRVRENGEPEGRVMPDDPESFVKTSGEFIKSIFEHKNPNCFVYQAGSYFIRNDILPLEPPEFMTGCCVGDVPMELYCASQGTAVYLAEELSCYRVMSRGSWTSQTRKTAERQTEIQKNMAACLKAYEEFTEHIYDPWIERKLAEIELGILVLNRRFCDLRKEPYRSMSALLAPKLRIKFWLYGHCHGLMELYDRRRGM